MADGRVGVLQATAPDRQIDNEVVLNDAAQTVYRQKVAVVNSDDGPLSTQALALVTDSVRQTQRPMSSYVAAQSSVDGTVTAADVTAPNRVRILRLDGGSKPSNAADTFCTVTIALGPTNVFVKELQVGEPIGGQVCLEGAAGEDLKVTVTGTGTCQFNLRYESFV